MGVRSIVRFCTHRAYVNYLAGFGFSWINGPSAKKYSCYESRNTSDGLIRHWLGLSPSWTLAWSPTLLHIIKYPPFSIQLRHVITWDCMAPVKGGSLILTQYAWWDGDLILLPPLSRWGLIWLNRVRLIVRMGWIFRSYNSCHSTLLVFHVRARLRSRLRGYYINPDKLH